MLAKQACAFLINSDGFIRRVACAQCAAHSIKSYGQPI